MSLQTVVLATSLLLTILLSSSWSGAIANSTKFSGENPPTNYSVPPHVHTAANNITNGSTQSTTPTMQSVHTGEMPSNITPVTTLHSEANMTSRPTQLHVKESEKGSTSPRAGRAHVAVMSALIALVISLSAVGIVATVFFVRWKRIKKRKLIGFQEEMATICLHDELASETLYSTWKPFMDNNDSNKMKLVIEPSNQDVQNSQANIG